MHLGHYLPHRLRYAMQNRTYYLRNAKGSWSQFPLKSEWYYETKCADNGRTSESYERLCTICTHGIWDMHLQNSAVRLVYIQSTKCPGELNSILGQEWMKLWDQRTVNTIRWLGTLWPFSQSIKSKAKPKPSCRPPILWSAQYLHSLVSLAKGHFSVLKMSPAPRFYAGVFNFRVHQMGTGMYF